jgi:hypothetical protein
MGVALRTTSFAEPANISDVVKYEHGTYCREVVTILSGAGVLAIGTPLGKVGAAAATAAAKSGGNTGNGTFVIDGTTPTLAGAKVGVYTLRCITAVTNGGVFRLEDPDGVVLGDFTIPAGPGNSVTISERIKGVLTDGSTDFVAGDGFDITVAVGSGKYVGVNPAGNDGRQIADALLLQVVDATSADKQAVVLVRGPAEISNLGIVWPTAVDDAAKKAAVIAQLAAKGIVTRASA